MSKKLTILVSPLDAVGHVNACTGIGESLRERGHRVIFAIFKSFEGTLKRYGFEEVILDEENGKKPGEEIALNLVQSGVMKGMSSLQTMQVLLGGSVFRGLIEKRKQSESRFKAVINQYNPDIIIIDDVVGPACLINSRRPWVLIVSTNPLYMVEDERTPPAGSGYPSNGDRSQWEIYREMRAKSDYENRLLYNNWMSELGLPHLTNKVMYTTHSPYLNIYGYPQELDYTDIRPMPTNWLRIDCFSRIGEQDFKLPENFENRDKDKQKLIYLSLGSMGSIDIELMKRLVNILSKSPHKYIISKGLFGDKYELGDNMWGDKYVPQTKILPLVDLVITHGGNNTVTETFSFGKPMIVMPLSFDQFDNAQRIYEKGYGIRLEPYNCTENQLLEGIEKLLNDNNLKEKLRSVSLRILQSKSKNRVSEMIEKLID